MAASQEVAFQQPLTHMFAENFHDTAVHRKACVTGYVKRRDAMIYGVVDAMNQMTFTEDTPQ